MSTSFKSYCQSGEEFTDTFLLQSSFTVAVVHVSGIQPRESRHLQHSVSMDTDRGQQSYSACCKTLLQTAAGKGTISVDVTLLLSSVM